MSTDLKGSLFMADPDDKAACAALLAEMDMRALGAGLEDAARMFTDAYCATLRDCQTPVRWGGLSEGLRDSEVVGVSTSMHGMLVAARHEVYSILMDVHSVSSGAVCGALFSGDLVDKGWIRDVLWKSDEARDEWLGSSARVEGVMEGVDNPLFELALLDSVNGMSTGYRKISPDGSTLSKRFPQHTLMHAARYFEALERGVFDGIKVREVKPVSDMARSKHEVIMVAENIGKINEVVG